MEEFEIILLEGLFYMQATVLRVEQADGEHVNVLEQLEKSLDRHVKFALHHVPLDGMDESLVGGGSCKWSDALGDCPAGHKQYPDRLLAFHAEGVLRADPWHIEAQTPGANIPIPFRGMPGHQGRLTSVTVLDLVAMHGKLKAVGLSIDEIKRMDVGKIQATLARLQKAVRK